MRPLLIIVLSAGVITACASPAIPESSASSSPESPMISATATEASLPSPTIPPTAAAIPTGTAIPTLVPGLELTSWKDSGYPDPSSVPLAEWCGIPIISTSMAGDQMEDLLYVYKTPTPPMEVYQHYLAEMPESGWELYLVGSNAVDAVAPETSNLDEFHGMLFYQRNSFAEQGAISLRFDPGTGLTYVIILCGG